MLDTPEKVINTLKTITDCYCLKSNFIICPKSNKSGSNYREPFCNGFLSEVDKRFELINRLSKLDGRERTTLLLFYTFSKPVDFIADRLGISLRHFYRVKKRALEDVINFDKQEESYS